MTSDNIQFIWIMHHTDKCPFMEYLWKNFPELKERFVSAEKFGEYKWKVTFKRIQKVEEEDKSKSDRVDMIVTYRDGAAELHILEDNNKSTREGSVDIAREN